MSAPGALRRRPDRSRSGRRRSVERSRRESTGVDAWRSAYAAFAPLVAQGRREILREVA